MSISGINLDEDDEPRGDNWEQMRFARACEQWSLFTSTGKLCTSHHQTLTLHWI